MELMPEATIVVHAGAGSAPRELDADETPCRQALEMALLAGAGELARGREATAAAVAAVRILEDSPLFNAGRGSVLNSEGAVEMDAALASGAERRAGAVAVV